MTDQPQTDRQNGDGLQALANCFPEINPGNYDDHDVEALNNWGIEVVTSIRATPQPTRDGAEGVCPNCGSTAPDHDFGCYRAPPKPAPDAMRSGSELRSMVAISAMLDCIGDVDKDDHAVAKILCHHEIFLRDFVHEREVSSAPVPPADGDKRVKLSLVIEALESAANDARKNNISGFDALTGVAILLRRDNPTSGARAAKPGNAQMLEYARRLNDIAIDVELAQGGLGGTANASDLRRIAQQIVAAPPVRGDREAVARIICCGPAGCRFVGDSEDGHKCYCDTSDFNGSGVDKKTSAILSLRVQPGAGEREALQPFATFGFDESGNNIRDGLMRDRICDWFGPSDFDAARAALSRQAPPSSSEGGR